MEALAIERLLVSEMIERIGHEIDRDEVDAPSFDTDRRHPWRQHVAHLLNGLEEVVRAIDLVDVARLRMSDHETGTVDSPRPLAFVAHDSLGQVLGAKVRVIEILGFLEHVLAKHAVVETRGGDGADVMEAPDL